MKKYGIDNFDIEVLETIDNKENLKQLEIYYIKKFDSYNNGYNMTVGGDIVSNETRKKISEKMIGREITWADKVVVTRRKNCIWEHGELSGKDHPKSKPFLVEYPNGSLKMKHGIRDFCKKQKLNYYCFYDTYRGKQNQHKGYVLFARFNDYGESQYTQVSGSGAPSVARADG